MLVIMDESLLDIEPVAAGLKKEGCAVVNSRTAPGDLDLGLEVRCISVDATSVALDLLKAPIVNTAILSAMVKAKISLVWNRYSRPSPTASVRSLARKLAASTPKRPRSLSTDRRKAFATASVL